MYIIDRAVDETDDEAIAAAGIDPGPDDLVVVLIQFGGPVEDRIIGGHLIGSKDVRGAVRSTQATNDF